MTANIEKCKKRGGWSLEDFNRLPAQKAEEILMQCNTSKRWYQQMAQNRPFATIAKLKASADKLWQQSNETDLLHAFEGHPEIGDISTLRDKYKHTAASAGHEQSGVNNASDEILKALAQGNTDYKEKFGFIFIVCASGKSANEMLKLLLARLPNTRKQELINAAEEQRKITQLRLEKLFT